MLAAKDYGGLSTKSFAAKPILGLQMIGSYLAMGYTMMNNPQWQGDRFVKVDFSDYMRTLSNVTSFYGIHRVSNIKIPTSSK